MKISRTGQLIWEKRMDGVNTGGQLSDDDEAIYIAETAGMVLSSDLEQSEEDNIYFDSDDDDDDDDGCGCQV